MTHVLLSRDSFREAVFSRDGHKCVFCSEPAADAHHILERRLWPDGGYYLDNGASVCGEHHLACERTDVSVEEVRIACGITKPVIPPHLYSDQVYDKWGNPVMPNGTRLRGDYDESVQKVIKDHLHEFTHLVKYPRTYHAPWSECVRDDDRVVESMAGYEGERVIITKKMDGENTTMYRDHFHARSLDSRHHPSRDWAKNFWSSIKHDIPEGWRVCGENLYAEHSIRYEDLDSFFLGFSVWGDRNVCLSWDETIEWLSLLGVTPVQVIYDGEYSESEFRRLFSELDKERDEGLVMRLAKEFPYSEFRKSVCKVVRKDHVQTEKHHWASQRVVPNSIRRDY